MAGDAARSHATRLHDHSAAHETDVAAIGAAVLSGDITVDTHQAHDIGTLAASIQDIYAQDLFLVESLDAAGGPAALFVRRRASDAAVADNDLLGALEFWGRDTATTDRKGASVYAVVDGSPGSNVMPTEIVISTSLTTIADRWRYSPDGHHEPMNDGTMDVGADATRVRRGYFDDIHTAAISLGAEDFNAYDEGTFTPTLDFSAGTGDLSIVYTIQEGRYTRTGNKVTVWFVVATSTFTHTTATGRLIVDSMPFTCQNATNQVYRGSFSGEGWTLASVSGLSLRALKNNATVDTMASRSGADIIPMSTTHFPSAANVLIEGTITYEVSD